MHLLSLCRPHQGSGADGGVEAGHVHILADATHHPHEELQLPARAGGQEEGANLQGLDGHALRLRPEKTYTHTHTQTVRIKDDFVKESVRMKLHLSITFINWTNR